MAGKCPKTIILLILLSTSLITQILCTVALSQEPCTTMNEMQITSSKIDSYKVYLDGNYIGTEGKNGDTLDGVFTIHNIPCWSNHTIFIDDGKVTYTLDNFFGGGIPYVIILEDPLFILGKSENADTSNGIMEQATNSPINQNQPPSMVDLVQDLQSPQEPGTTVTWRATATDPENDPIYYKFLLKGPKTSDQWQTVKDWSQSNVWSWKTEDKDVGSSDISVQIRDAKHADTSDMDDFKDITNYKISEKRLTDLNVEAANDLYTRADPRVYYCPDGKYISYRNRVYLTGPDLDKIAKVKYVLPPSFPHPEQTSDDSSNSFEIWILTWGRFNGLAYITTKSGQTFEKPYYISFKSKVQESKSRGIPQILNCEG